MHATFVTKQEYMTLNRLHDDLLNDFRKQKEIINQQIELFDPLATSLRRPAAQRLMSKGGLVVAETGCYLLGAGALAFMVVMNLVFPFTLLSKVRYITDIRNGLSYTDAEYFSIAVHAMAGFIGLLFYITARIIRRVRLKNDILDLAGRNIKTLVGQHLNRRASMDAIAQRHFLENPEPLPQSNVVSIPNPGYDPLD